MLLKQIGIFAIIQSPIWNDEYRIWDNFDHKPLCQFPTQRQCEDWLRTALHQKRVSK